MEACDDAFFEELRAFRQQHQAECCAQLPLGSWAESRDPVPAAPPPPTVQPAFRVNERLHLVETDASQAGRSVLPSEFHKYVRVSIPASAMGSSPNTRVSGTAPLFLLAADLGPQQKLGQSKRFDPNQSMSLTEHCVSGWESAQPSMAPAKVRKIERKKE